MFWIHLNENILHKYSKMEIRCINWFESHSERRYLFLKSRTRDKKTIFIRFPYYFYYVVTDEIFKSLTPIPYKYTSMGNMKIISIDENVSFNTDIMDRKQTITEIWLLEELKRRTIQKVLMDEFLNITWFFISNNIVPDGCYILNTDYLQKINNTCYHCEYPKECFNNTIERFDISRSYLFIDIECQFDKKFPSVFTNPISHISCCYIDLSDKKFNFTLINDNMLSNKEKEDAISRGYYLINDVNDMDYDRDFVICPEIILLRIIKKLLELTFDFIITFNGHNFDLRYISNRLELLTNDKIIFKSPDKLESVHLCIYERNQSSHKGTGGVSHTTYHINNNNGTIFFDLYTFIQKSEKLDSYKLDSISKNAFKCTAILKKNENGICTFIGNESTDSKGMHLMFSKVLSTGNYITIGDDVYKILEKKVDTNGFCVKLFNNNNNNNKMQIGEFYDLAFGKDDVDLSNMYKNYNLDIALEMGKYCIHDACLCYYLWDYYGIETKTDAGASTYLLPQSMVFEYRASTLIKGPLLKLLLETKIILSRSEKKQRYQYEGGKVFAPKQKMFVNNVLIFDYNSLYPNVCLFGNLSPETLIGVVVSNNKLESEINNQELLIKYPPPQYILVYCEPRSTQFVSEVAIFDRRTEGTIPLLLKKFLSERSYYKKMLKNAKTQKEKSIYDSMQYTYKIIANSVYGLMGFRNSALYSYASAKSCTSIGRRMILYLDTVLNGSKLISGKLILASPPIKPYFNDNKINSVIIQTTIFNEQEFNFKSVYGDTDSIFLEINSKDIEISITIAKELEKIINEQILFDNFRIEFEAVYKNLIMQSKKKYTTIKFSSLESIPERINKGTSETRRDVSRFHKEMIKVYKTRILQMLSDGLMTPSQVCIDILKSLENDLLIEFKNKISSLDMFLLSRRHHCNYKSIDNPNMSLVVNYNKNNLEKIEIGERYFFAYICNNNEPWQKRLVNIKTYERIIDRGFKLQHDERIFYEVYFKRLATEVINLLDNKVISTSFFEKMFGTKPIFYN
nr:DNA polymerase [Wadden Sea poxvirus]